MIGIARRSFLVPTDEFHTDVYLQAPEFGRPGLLLSWPRFPSANRNSLSLS